MKISQLINELVKIAIEEGEDFEFRIYDDYCGCYREFTIDKKHPTSSVINLSEDVDV